MSDAVAGLMVHVDGTALIQQRVKGKFAGQWELPGGKVEPGETHARALEREWREELGVEVVVGREELGVEVVVGRVLDATPGPTPGEGSAQHNLYVYRVYALGHRVLLKPHEGQPTAWVCRGDLGCFNILAFDRAVMRRVME